MAERDISVRNSLTGDRIWARLLGPGAGRTPVVVFAPGGLGAGADLLADAVHEPFLEAGLAVAVFDPNGRGASAGREDWGGPVHQRTLCDVLARAAAEPTVDPNNVGVVSLSLGLAMAAGALGRPEGTPAVRYLVDFEGPTDRFYITANDAPEFVDLFDGRTTDQVDWWAPREAVRSLAAARVCYLRVQFEEDHVHGRDVGHAVDAIRAATHRRYGGRGCCPWTCVNSPTDNTPNRVFTRQSPPICAPTPAGGDVRAVLARAARELAD